MNDNEKMMKSRGEKKVWKNVLTKNGDFKNISSTQLGQQMLLDDALEILPKIRLWIEEGSAKVYRGALQKYFKDDDILLEKILQSFLLMSGAIYESVSNKNKKVIHSRHKKISTLQSKVMPELSFDLVWRFLEICIDLSQYFSVEKDLSCKDGDFKTILKYSCNMSESIIEKLAIDAAKAFYPLPMRDRPIDWKYYPPVEIEGQPLPEFIEGGYSDFQFEMVRAHMQYVDYSKFSQAIYDSINYIQSTAWIVNKDLLQAVKADLRAPLKSQYIKNEYPSSDLCKWDIKIKEANCGLTKREIAEVILEREDFQNKAALYNADVSDYESELGKYRAIRLAIQIAEEYQDDEQIYFPHSFDFRGRIYPLPIGLSPQGSDAVKSLLLYKNTQKLTERGEKWNWAYLASLYGDDKLDFEDRVERGKQLLEADYHEADEPYQFLSHQIEIKKWVKDSNYIPNTRIHLDACNSGSQFTSAITGDKKGCLATNVIPTFNKDGGQDRQDAYLLVAERSLKLTEQMISKEKDVETKSQLRFLKGLLVENGRKICKVPVMVSNYGGTAGGRADILWSMFRELGVDRKWITKKNASLFGKIIGDSIHGVLSGGKAFETYIHAMNNIIAKANKPIQWTTSDGFHVVHVKNKELKAKQVSCTLPNSRKQTTIIKKIYSNKVSSVKMKSAISPNFIHSLDAELLRRVALKMRDAGVVDSDWIHDSFGSHPNDVDLMLMITKKEFAKLVRRAPLKLLDQQLRKQIPTILKNREKKAVELVKFPSLRGFSIANGDIDIVMESDWFFS